MNTLSCLCGERRLMTVNEVSSLPLMAHIGEPILRRLIDAGTLPARPFGPRKTLVLVTEYCPAHQTKVPDDLDAFLENTTPRPPRKR